MISTDVAVDLDSRTLVDGETCHVIDAAESLPTFLMTLTSASDVWAYLTSNGGITAGRRNADRAIFPYRTEDLVADAADNTGGVTRLQVTDAAGVTSEWWPFHPVRPELPAVHRRLLKTDLGDVVHLEEERPDLSATVRVTWRVSPTFGLVRTVTLSCADARGIDVTVLDGIRNVLPPGVTARTQRELGPLLDAYKVTEIDPATGLAWVRLNSRLTDRAEAAESLAVSSMWQVAAPVEEHFISTSVLTPQGDDPGRTQVRGERAAYLIRFARRVTPEEPARWSVVTDTGLDAPAVIDLRERLREPARLAEDLEADIAQGRARLRALVGAADGWTRSGEPLADAHHASSTMFNIMRGGVPPHGYRIERADVCDFLATRNRRVADRWASRLEELPDELTIQELRTGLADVDDPDLQRLVAEYLPLTFSRRHGDPSRPWNIFEIRLTDDSGAPRLAHQGNWRDIFQNWEALAWSFPELTESFVRTFVNATTVDGYNPYRISRDGVDWEVPEPEDPWSNIGYWSDHQIIYLLRLLELLKGQYPERHDALLASGDFVHVDVPYIIAPYEELLADAKNTVGFDEDRHTRSMARVGEIGGDGRLLVDPDGELVRAGFVEKLLILLTAKMVNFVPEGGIWMNTQRPEWNDANNALVGRGLSVVTVAYLHRFVEYLLEVLPDRPYDVPAALADAVHGVTAVLTDAPPPAEGGIDDSSRRAMLDELGAIGTTYRAGALKPSTGRSTLTSDEVRRHLEAVRAWLAHTVRIARRDDGLFHAYNLLALRPGAAGVEHLDQMLEGQVAVLSSGVLTPADALVLLEAMPSSGLYREDARSYQLYPEKHISSFLERNIVPAARHRQNALLTVLLERSDHRLVVADRHGGVHFASPLQNAEDVSTVLARMADEAALAPLVESSGADVLDIFEEVFKHSEFTGRSSSFFAYEGVGSIYWHMVSKLLLAVREQLDAARRSTDSDPGLVEGLATAYEQVRDGLGYRKTAQEYGAFPHDAYSHTPAGRGARQPGMTGQVKEDMLARWAELGLCLSGGRLHVDAGAIRPVDWTEDDAELAAVDVDGQELQVDLPTGSVGLTLCQVPIVVSRVPGGDACVRAFDGDGGLIEERGDGGLSPELSASVFAR
ncbi:MAG: hypothetical protein ABR500_08920, partial [Dermatophilaceae bacterium]